MGKKQGQEQTPIVEQLAATMSIDGKNLKDTAYWQQPWEHNGCKNTLPTVQKGKWGQGPSEMISEQTSCEQDGDSGQTSC